MTQWSTGMDKPWITLGDFNNVLHYNDRIWEGGGSYSNISRNG